MSSVERDRVHRPPLAGEDRERIRAARDARAREQARTGARLDRSLADLMVETKQPATIRRGSIVDRRRRERQIVFLLSEGRRFSDVAAELGVSTATVTNELAELRVREKCRTTIQLVALFVRRGDV